MYARISWPLLRKICAENVRKINSSCIYYNSWYLHECTEWCCTLIAFVCFCIGRYRHIRQTMNYRAISPHGLTGRLIRTLCYTRSSVTKTNAGHRLSSNTDQWDSIFQNIPWQSLCIHSWIQKSYVPLGRHL